MKNTKYILLLIIIALFSGCKENKVEKVSFLQEKINNSKLKDYIVEFMNKDKDNSLYAFFPVKYHKDTSKYLLTTIFHSRNEIYNNNPDEIMKIGGHYLLLCFGYSNLSQPDTIRMQAIVDSLQKGGIEIIEDDSQDTFTVFARIIDVVHGRYSIGKLGEYEYCDILPTSKFTIKFLPPEKKHKRKTE